MNDDELRARLRMLREPPVDPVSEATALRRSLAALNEHAPGEVAAPAVACHGSLREWLWPSPLAWGALAAIWIAIAASEKLSMPAEAQKRRTLAAGALLERSEESYRPLFAHQEYRDLLRRYQKPPAIE